MVRGLIVADDQSGRRGTREGVAGEANEVGGEVGIRRRTATAAALAVETGMWNLFLSSRCCLVLC